MARQLPVSCSKEEPIVERIATDVEHLAYIRFAVAMFDSSNRFATQVVTVRGRHQRSLLSFISLLYVLTLTSRAITVDAIAATAQRLAYL